MPALLVVPARVGAEQHAIGFEAGVQLAEYSRQLLIRHMEQAGVGEDAVEACIRQVEGQEVLLPDFTAAAFAGHLDEARAAVQADGGVAQGLEGAQVAARAAAEIEDLVRRLALDMPQQCGDVLADIVIAGAFAKVFGAVLVMGQGQGADLREVVGAEHHAGGLERKRWVIKPHLPLAGLAQSQRSP
ncbi:hypothetical protein D9M68_764660 [compost metagenome]